jgi:mono/diheme cytochrome c family protein
MMIGLRGSGNRQAKGLFRTLLFGLVVLGMHPPAITAAPAQPDPTRGELLYSTHCISCHSTKMHWRDKKLAVDGPTLLVQVRRWMEFSGLAWSDDDTAGVARYLNGTYYHFPDPLIR